MRRWWRRKGNLADHGLDHLPLVEEEDADEGLPDGWVPTEADKQQALEALRHTWETTREDRRGWVFDSVIAENKEVVVRYWEGTGLNREAAETAAALEIAAIPKQPRD